MGRGLELPLFVAQSGYNSPQNVCDPGLLYSCIAVGVFVDFSSAETERLSVKFSVVANRVIQHDKKPRKPRTA